MKVILIGYGNIGQALHQLLSNQKIKLDVIIRSSGIYSSDNLKIDETDNYSKYLDHNTVVFVAVPSIKNGDLALPYYLHALEKGAAIVTCEKAFLAYHWDDIKARLNKIKYSATVGGDSGILPAISACHERISEIRAVVNGTLNYIGEKVVEGVSEEEIFNDVTNKGFAEPGSRTFNEVIDNELQDVLYKTVILANHSKLYAHTIQPTDISLEGYRKGLRCSVLLDRVNTKAGFISAESDRWFPSGVNNVLYINQQKKAEGPGAGAQVTAERMLKDYKEFLAVSMFG